MNKSQLIEALSAHFEGNKRAASHALESVVETVTREVARGGKVAITGFGAFEKVIRPSRMVRNPRTGERTRAKKTAVPKFRPGSDLKAVVSGDRKMPKVSTSKATAAATRTTSSARKTATSAAGTAKKTAQKAAAKSSGGAKKTAAKTSGAAKSTAKKAPASKTATRSAGSAKKSAAKTSGAAKSTAKKAPASKTATKSAGSAKKTAARSTGSAKKTAKRS